MSLLEALQQRLTGIRIKDMTPVFEQNYRKAMQSSDKYLKAHHSDAFLVMNTPLTRPKVIGFIADNVQAVFYHNDNFALVPNTADMNRAIDACLAVVPGYYQTCSICMELMDPDDQTQFINHKLLSTKILPCGHQFHFNCIKQWLNESGNCPNCRSEAEGAFVNLTMKEYCNICHF